MRCRETGFLGGPTQSATLSGDVHHTAEKHISAVTGPLRPTRGSFRPTQAFLRPKEDPLRPIKGSLRPITDLLRSTKNLLSPVYIRPSQADVGPS